MQLIGLARLGRDCVLRYTPDKKPVANMALCYNYGFKDQSTGNKASQWVECSLWGVQAEKLTEHLTKGKMLCVTINEVHIEEYESKGEKKSKLVGIISNLEFAGDSKNSSSPVSEPKTSYKPPETKKSSPNFDDSDVPF